MKIKPNKCVLEGTVRRIERAADGIGAEVVLSVDSSEAAEGFEDFVGARPGSELTLFAADPDDVEEGGRYRVTASLLGGPRGQRVVLQSARAKPKTER